MQKDVITHCEWIQQMAKPSNMECMNQQLELEMFLILKITMLTLREQDVIICFLH